MNTYTYSEARQKLAALLDRALMEGEVRIRRKDGQVFVLRPQPRVASPLDIEGIDLGFTRTEIVEFVQESRRRYEIE
jgi:hypothetical protein